MSIRWSLTPIITFRVCQRKYFLSQILAKNNKHATLIEKQAYWLKKSVSLDMWAGNIIDYLMSNRIIPVYENCEEPNFEELEDFALKLMRRQWEFSKNGLYRTTNESQNKEEFCILDVHENNTTYSKEDLKLVVAKVKTSIQNIKITKLPDGSLLTDLLKNAEWRAADKNDRRVGIGKASVAPQIDLLAWANSTQYIIDWKVSDSKNSDYSRQLGLIGMVVYRKRIEKFHQEEEEGKPAWMYDQVNTRIVLYEVNLFKGYIKEHPFTKEIYGELVDYVNKTTHDIDIFSKDRSPNEIPLIEYAFTESEYACNTCPFTHLCNYLIENSNDTFSTANYRKFIRDNEFV